MITLEEYRKEPEVHMNIPFLIRLLEYAREDVKTDIELHKVVEKMIALGSKTLTMADYKKIAS